jgi:hypothetical protein
MNDCIEIGTDWPQFGIVIDDGFDMELTVESGFDIMVKSEFENDSEIHIIMGDIVHESKADETEYDFEMEFSDADTSFIYVGPALPEVEVTWNSDAWFHSDGWFESEAW